MAGERSSHWVKLERRLLRTEGFDGHAQKKTSLTPLIETAPLLGKLVN